MGYAVLAIGPPSFVFKTGNNSAQCCVWHTARVESIDPGLPIGDGVHNHFLVLN
jgi:hypothetical protein